MSFLYVGFSIVAVFGSCSLIAMYSSYNFDVHTFTQPAFCTVVTKKEEAQSLDNLVGSYHNCNYSDPFVVFMHPSLEAKKEEVEMWRGVTVGAISNKKGYNCTNVALDVIFDKKCRNYSILQVEDQVPNKHLIDLRLREDILTEYNSRKQTWMLTPLNITELRKTRRVIGIGIPCLSKKSSDIYSTPVVKQFIPSFMESIKQEPEFLFILYIGFDNKDEIFENAYKQKMIENIIAEYGQDNVLVSYVRFPRCKWLSFLWSLLYIAALEDNCEFYYQIGDDITFETNGWATRFVDILDSQDKIGVVAPFDKNVINRRRLFTQSFVSRKHYDIFKTLYPLELRNWYSDDWMTNVYGKFGIWATEMNITNAPKAPRYRIAGSRKLYKIQLQIGQQMFDDYLAENNYILPTHFL